MWPSAVEAGGGQPPAEERRLLATQLKPAMPTRKRKHCIGTNRGDAVVGVPALALGIDSMWALPLGKKRELLGIFRVDVGGPTGSYGEEDDWRGRDCGESIHGW